MSIDVIVVSLIIICVITLALLILIVITHGQRINRMEDEYVSEDRHKHHNDLIWEINDKIRDLEEYFKIEREVRPVNTKYKSKEMSR